MKRTDFDITEINGIIIDIDHVEFGNCPFWDVKSTDDDTPPTEISIRAEILKFLNGEIRYLDIWSDNDPEEQSTACYIKRTGTDYSITRNLEELICWLNEERPVYVCHVEDNLL